MKEAIIACESITENKMSYSYSEDNRIGDHIWWISDLSKFRQHYPEWNWKYNMDDIISQIYDSLIVRTG